jgi:hypothetical protein
MLEKKRRVVKTIFYKSYILVGKRSATMESFDIVLVAAAIIIIIIIIITILHILQWTNTIYKYIFVPKQLQI